jgi:hypothetical protein
LAAIFAAYLFYQSRQPKVASISFGSINSAKIAVEQNLPLTIDTAGATINAAEIYLKFNPDQVEVLSVNKEKSIFSFWVTDQPTFSNEKGEITFAGGLPTPGFSGSGQVGSVKIKPKKTGDISFVFEDKTRALKNDGLGTQINLHLSPITIEVGK